MKQLIAGTIVATLMAAQPGSADQITLLDGTDFAWETAPEGVAFAPLQGDRFAEPYQALVRLPAGTVRPLHVKSANMDGVILQGEMIHYASDESPDIARKIGAGACYRIPCNRAHVSACVPAAPCVTYLYQDGAFDFVPVEQ